MEMQHLKIRKWRMMKSRRIRWAGHVACMVERGSVPRVFVRKPEGKRRGETYAQLGR
jgi:hypothetical protein